MSKIIDRSLLKEVADYPFMVEYSVVKGDTSTAKERIILEQRMNNRFRKSKIITAKELFKDYEETDKYYSYRVPIKDTSFDPEIQFDEVSDGVITLIAYKSLDFSWYRKQTGINTKMSLNVISTLLTINNFRLVQTEVIEGNEKILYLFQSYGNNVVVGIETLNFSKTVNDICVCYRIKSCSDEEEEATKLLNRKNDRVNYFFDESFYYSFQYSKIFPLAKICDISFFKSTDNSLITIDPIIFFDSSNLNGKFVQGVVSNKLEQYKRLRNMN